MEANNGLSAKTGDGEIHYDFELQYIMEAHIALSAEIGWLGKGYGLCSAIC